MKKTIQSIVILGVIILAVACGGQTESTESTDSTTTKNDTAKVDTTTAEDETPASLEKTGLLEINELQAGDVLAGMTVKNIDYQSGSHYTIELEGEWTVEGQLGENPMEYTTELFLSESKQPDIQIKTQEGTFPFCQVVAFNNKSAMEANLNTIQQHKLKAGEQVPISITIKNVSISTNFDKGRQAMAQADFLKINVE